MAPRPISFAQDLEGVMDLSTKSAVKFITGNKAIDIKKEAQKDAIFREQRRIFKSVGSRGNYSITIYRVHPINNTWSCGNKI